LFLHPQGLLDGEDGEGEGSKDQPPEGPMCLWKPERVVADYRTAKKLVGTIDHQRGLKLAENPLLPQAAIAAAGGGDGQDGEGKDADMGELGWECGCVAGAQPRGGGLELGCGMFWLAMSWV
jgi:hypothetical protein